MLYKFTAEVAGVEVHFHAIVSVKLPQEIAPMVSQARSGFDEPPGEGEVDVHDIFPRSPTGVIYRPIGSGPIFDALQAILLDDHLDRIFEHARDEAKP